MKAYADIRELLAPGKHVCRITRTRLSQPLISILYDRHMMQHSIRSTSSQTRLVRDYDISFVSTGDVLRKEIAAKSEVGKKAEQVVATGGE